MNYNTTRKGVIGQEIVKLYLLTLNARVFEPVCDDFGIDLLVETKNGYKTIQVKYHNCKQTKSVSSIQIFVDNTKADWIATPFNIDGQTKIIWFKNDLNKKKWGKSFSITKPMNNQTKNINFYWDYLKSPVE